MHRVIPLSVAVMLALSGCAAPTNVEAPVTQSAEAPQAANPSIGGAVMDPARSIADNLSQSQDHTTLVAAMRASGVLETLGSAGSFTLFAPDNDAFQRLPNGTMESLMAPANRALLARLINYHVVRGNKSRSQILADISAGGGVASYQTVAGGSIRLSRDGAGIAVSDVRGNRASLTVADARLANGVLHVVSGVLIPAF